MAGSISISSCSSGSDYERAAERTAQTFDEHPHGKVALYRECVRYATLAASSHNTQPWTFSFARNVISLQPDFRRRCPIVDSDNHHLFVSLGCATENLAQAALAHGYWSEVRDDTGSSAGITVALSGTKARSSALYQAIPHRQSTRSHYDGRPVPLGQLRQLELSGTLDGVRLLMLTEYSHLDRIADYVIEGNTLQSHNPQFVNELRTWMRFNDNQAIATGDGLSVRCTGNTSMPTWMGDFMLPYALQAKSENDQIRKYIRSSSGVAIFISEDNTIENWIKAGRCFQRFALHATSLGIRTAMLNQVVEVAALRAKFAGMLGVGSARPDLVVRFGYAPAMPRSLRRPLSEVTSMMPS